MASDIVIAGVTYPQVPSVTLKNPQNQDVSFIIPAGTKQISANGVGIDVSGYASANVTVPVPVIAAKSGIITPGTSQTPVYPDSGVDGMSSVQIAGDADLVGANIKRGVNIFDVPGTFSDYTRTMTGSFTGTGATNWKLEIDASTFEPKAVIVYLNGAFNSSSSNSTYYFSMLFALWDEVTSPGSTTQNRAATFVSRTGSGTSSSPYLGRAGLTQSSWTRSGTTISFTSIASGSNSFVFRSGTSYNYIVWG